MAKISKKNPSSIHVGFYLANTHILKTQSFVLSLRAKPVVDYVLSLQSLFSNYYTVYIKQFWGKLLVFFNDG